MQFSLRNLILVTTTVAFCSVFAGRDANKGSVVVGQQDENFIYSLLGEQGINAYESYSSSGITHFYFLDANQRGSIEDAIEMDALVKGYSFKIIHRTILLPFSSVRIVNPEASLLNND
ncbi:MAG: hypothetical protein ABI557_08110 [Aureliella sp.]